MANEAKSMQLKLVPVTGLNRHATYQAATRSVAKIMGNGICLRIYSSDLARRNFAMELLDLVSNLKVRPEETDLIVDLEVAAESNMRYAQLCRQIPNQSPLAQRI